MSSQIFLENEKYISIKDASSLTSYSKDYLGQLCRQDKIKSHRMGRTWYVSEKSLLSYKSAPIDFDFLKNLNSHPKNTISKPLSEKSSF